MNPTTISPCQSSYLIEKSPLFYGGKQEEYNELAEQAISSAINLIEAEMANKMDPSMIYHKVISLLQNARHEISLKHNPNEAHFFGIPRNIPEAHQVNYAPPITGLWGHYKEYNQKYIERLTKILAEIPHDLKTFQKTSCAVHETIMGKRCSFEVELIDGEELTKRKYNSMPSEKELHEALGIRDKTSQEITKDYHLMKELKIKQKDLYDRITINPVLIYIGIRFPSPSVKEIDDENFVRYEKKSMYVLGTLRLEIEPNKMVCLARHLTWMYQDWTNDPVDTMKEHSVNYIIHQDPFLIERTQNVCGRMFADILELDKTKSLDDLKNSIALLRFVYGNSMPCSRGDGAIGDWLELALYRHHGYPNTKHNNNRLPCFELLTTTTLSEYLKEYPETIVVQ